MTRKYSLSFQTTTRWCLAGAAALLAGYGCAGGEETTNGGADAISTAVGTGGGAVVTTTTAATGGAGGDDSGSGGEMTGSGGSDSCVIDCSTLPKQDCISFVCNNGQLPGDIGKCVAVNDDGAACDDGEFCTAGDICAGGQCVPGGPNDCGLPSGECTSVSCNEATDSCMTDVAMDGTVCPASGDLCQVNAQCQAGVCMGSPKDCSFFPTSDECHVALCNPANGMCEEIVGNDGQACIDANDLCTENKVCNAGVCSAGTAIDCSGLTQGCVAGMCDVANGTCGTVPIAQGSACNDSNGCSVGETCDAAAMCGGGAITTACVNNDQCCPTGCNETNDTDCILDVLLLGDDIPDTMGTLGWPEFRSGLSAAGVTWTEHNVDVMGFPTAAELANYNTIVWADQGFIAQGDVDIQKITDWLQLPGLQRLFVTTADFQADFATASVGSVERTLSDLFGSTYIASSAGSGITGLMGMVGDPIMGSFAATPLSISSTSADYGDSSLGPAISAGIYGPGGTGTGQAGLTHRATPDYKLVWLGVQFHNQVTSAPQRDQLMVNIMNYFKN